jgi:flagellar biosynthesis/type III secretory pathway protein FliH
MPEGFRSLASLLLDKPKAVSETESTVLQDAHDVPTEPHADEYAMLREMRLFRARIIEATEEAVETMLLDIASEVLGRELELAPADIEAILDRALQRYFEEQPLCVRVHPADCELLGTELALIADDSLQRGDAIVELRSGSIDARLGTRLASILWRRHE